MNGEVAVIGQGYVGLPMALTLVDSGVSVVGFDVDPERVRRLTAAESYVDDTTDAALHRALVTGRFHPTADEPRLAGCSRYLICVPTPLLGSTPDLRAVLASGGTACRSTRCTWRGARARTRIPRCDW